MKCPKKMLNGPCGGYNKDLCEDHRLRCVWIEAFNRLRVFGKEQELFRLKLDSKFRIRNYSPPKRRLTDYVGHDKIFLIYEYVPRKNLSLKNFEEDLRNIFKIYDALDFVQNPGGRPLIDPLPLASIAKKLYPEKKIGVQITGRDYDRDGVVSHVLAALAIGIDNIIATTGDLKFYSGDTYGVWDLDSPRMIYLIRLISDLGVDYSGRKIYSGDNRVLVGASLNPYLDPLEPEIYKIRVKLSAGADFLVTQPIFSIDTVERLGTYVEKLLNMRLSDIDLVISVSPVLDEKTVSFLRERSNVRLPGKLLEALERRDREEILRSNTAFIIDLISRIEDYTGNKIIYVSTYGDIAAGLYIAERIREAIS